MRILPVTLSLALLGSTVAAAESLHRIPSDGKTVGQMMTRLATLAAHRPAGRARQAIYFDTSLPSFLFQGAGSVQGKNGTFFHTDAMIANYRGTAQRLAVGWLAQGVDNSNSPLQYFSLDANTTVALDDFVTATLQQAGFGAVVVIGVDAQNNVDPNAVLDGQSRIWTLQPGSQGKVSLGLPGVDLADEVGISDGYALGLRHDPSARTNVGIVNLDSVSHTWTVHANGVNKSTSFDVQVPAYSVVQAAIPDGNYGNLFITLTPDVDGFDWSAYGVSVDNTTGDSWVSHVNQPLAGN
ncbi:MAG TPA: hypothetical protein VFL12_01725 [Thermoanaerobaculia bacterium]|nr:hypothetical protein [Thermoanaerobaculia bacterium]